MANIGPNCRIVKVIGPLVLAMVTLAGVPRPVAAQEPKSKDVTFAKDVAPILQAKCQTCHRPGQIAPMPLLTYEQARPWASAMKRRVAARQMPPWGIDKQVGIQKYKNDRSLSDREIDTVVRWADAGAPLGDPRDLPPPVTFNDEEWTIGKPDLIVSFPADFVIPAWGPDWWGDIVANTGLTEDRWIKATETRPSKAGFRVVHHATGSIEAEDSDAVAGPNGVVLRDSGGAIPQGNQWLTQYGAGKTGDIFPDNTGQLIKAGARVSWNMHYHSIGEEIRDRTSLAMVFYPKGAKPKYDLAKPSVSGGNDLDIPANSTTRHHGYRVLTKPTKLIKFQPHMHIRGHHQTLEAIYPDGRVEVLSAANYDFNWQTAYTFADDVAPLLPAGTVLHSISIHRNTAEHPGNPDPNVWVGWGNRSIDEMSNTHLYGIELDEADFKALVAERGAQKSRARDDN